MFVQCDLSNCNADNYISRQIRIRHPPDDDLLFDNVTAVSDHNGYNGTIRPCETSDKVFPLECNKTEMIICCFVHAMKDTTY